MEEKLEKKQGPITDWEIRARLANAEWRQKHWYVIALMLLSPWMLFSLGAWLIWGR